MKEIYTIDTLEVTREEFYERLEQEVQNYVEEYYDDILDECYPEVKIGCCTFYASEVLKQCDPVAYRCGMSDEVSYKLEDAQYEVENYGSTTVNKVDFEYQEIEEEDEESDE